MKILLDKGVTAVAENMTDVKVLISLAPETKTRKRYIHKKACNSCAFVAKGNRGLAIHKARSDCWKPA